MPDSDSNEELLRLKEQFVLVLCADYKQSKLIPYCGSSPQSGMTYYLQKMSYDIFGIIDCRDLKGYVYLAPETIDPKNTDHTMSYLTHFLTESGTIPSWVKRIHVFLDNAGSSNKNYYMAGFCQELVQQGVCSFFLLSFMIAGHTKFNVDRLFAKIAITYNRSDVFNCEDLAGVVERHAKVTIDNGEIIKQWRERLARKFAKLPGIRALHDFVIVKHILTDAVIMRVRELCSTGSFSNTTMKLVRGATATDVIIPTNHDCYKETNQCHELS